MNSVMQVLFSLPEFKQRYNICMCKIIYCTLIWCIKVCTRGHFLLNLFCQMQKVNVILSSSVFFSFNKTMFSIPWCFLSGMGTDVVQYFPRRLQTQLEILTLKCKSCMYYILKLKLAKNGSRREFTDSVRVHECNMKMHKGLWVINENT